MHHNTKKACTRSKTEIHENTIWTQILSQTKCNRRSTKTYLTDRVEKYTKPHFDRQLPQLIGSFGNFLIPICHVLLSLFPPTPNILQCMQFLLKDDAALGWAEPVES